ncbi:hypothetical protein Q4577_15785 [Marinovum sp. 2_MG-2023]|uniref:hypothetical protein n=1 Tax=unclassified Marinovum TaxID=2647166 RepID=UPI0026E34268|nr:MULTISPECIES: hypothetical protein [unclassified Marinovum]MDO6731495.1 hypothetical protein [Marinovum sp. 2_MG-2023]MDO6780855.1 hypothetical protein [Marinovum sp. 1_MG-2023]
MPLLERGSRHRDWPPPDERRRKKIFFNLIEILNCCNNSERRDSFDHGHKEGVLNLGYRPVRRGTQNGPHFIQLRGEERAIGKMDGSKTTRRSEKPKISREENT